MYIPHLHLAKFKVWNWDERKTTEFNTVQGGAAITDTSTYKLWP